MSVSFSAFIVLFGHCPWRRLGTALYSALFFFFSLITDGVLHHFLIFYTGLAVGNFLFARTYPVLAVIANSWRHSALIFLYSLLRVHPWFSITTFRRAQPSITNSLRSDSFYFTQASPFLWPVKLLFKPTFLFLPRIYAGSMTRESLDWFFRLPSSHS